MKCRCGLQNKGIRDSEEIIEADARIKIDASLGEIEDEVKRNEEHVQNEMNSVLKKSKLSQSHLQIRISYGGVERPLS